MLPNNIVQACIFLFLIPWILQQFTNPWFVEELAKHFSEFCFCVHNYTTMLSGVSNTCSKNLHGDRRWPTFQVLMHQLSVESSQHSSLEEDIQGYFGDAFKLLKTKLSNHLQQRCCKFETFTYLKSILLPFCHFYLHHHTISFLIKSFQPIQSTL
jgi:hypothetical protein